MSTRHLYVIKSTIWNSDLLTCADLVVELLLAPPRESVLKFKQYLDILHASLFYDSSMYFTFFEI